MIDPPGNRGGQNWLAAGRLKPGASLDRAQTEMTSISARLEELYPDSNKGRRVTVTRMREELVGNVRFTLYLLLGAVGVLLLIACANTATLLLGKATARAREIAVRAALGASRLRIVRQLVAESLLLALVAGALGLLLAYGGSNALVKLAPADLPRLSETAVDRWVLAFTMGMSILTSLLFGLVPAFYASKIELSEALKQAAMRVVGGGSVRLRGALVVAEIALAVMLVSGAGLLIKSFVALHNVALGFRPENVLVMRASVPAPPSVGITRARQFFKDTLSRVAGLPGVLAAGATMAPPGSVDSTGSYFIDQMPAQPDPNAPPTILSIVAPGMFAALGIPLKNGRDFNEGDALDRPFVAVVNESLARKAFPNQNPLGRTVFCPFDSFKGMTIVGVVGVRQAGGRADGGVLYAVTRSPSNVELGGADRGRSERAEIVRRLVRSGRRRPDAIHDHGNATSRHPGPRFTPVLGALGQACAAARRWRDGICGGPTVERSRPADRARGEHRLRAAAHPRAGTDAGWDRSGARACRGVCRIPAADDDVVPGETHGPPGVPGSRNSTGRGRASCQLYSGTTGIPDRSGHRN